MQQLVLVWRVELRIGVHFAQATNESLILKLGMKTEAILVGCIREVFSILIQCDVFCEVIEVLVLATAVANTCVAALNICRTNQTE
jgi:hypothetical protein